MIDELKSEKIVDKVGGRFRLTALIQKRLSELLQGARPLIEDAEGKTPLEIPEMIKIQNEKRKFLTG